MQHGHSYGASDPPAALVMSRKQMAHAGFGAGAVGSVEAPSVVQWGGVSLVKSTSVGV